MAARGSPQARDTSQGTRDRASAAPQDGVDDLEREVDATIAALHAVLQEPRVTKELLRRPPFRFLHDTVAAITAATGFADGLFDHVESDAVQLRKQRGKGGKLDYFQKLVTYVAIVLRCSPPALPTKIIAGKQPHRTNKLLQVRGMRACWAWAWNAAHGVVWLLPPPPRWHGRPTVCLQGCVEQAHQHRQVRAAHTGALGSREG